MGQRCEDRSGLPVSSITGACERQDLSVSISSQETTAAALIKRCGREAQIYTIPRLA